MRIKGKLEKIRIRFDSADVLDIDAKDVKDFNCSDIYDVFAVSDEFDEYECDYLCLSIFKKADKLINQGNLKGTVFSVIRKNIISWIEVYTTEESYKIYVLQEIMDADYVMDIDTGETMSQMNGYGDSYNLAQATGIDNKDNFVLIISQENIDRAYNEEGEDYYDD